jgi:bifunctional NMN adenylyltransferase/nudix hydrolase
MKVIDEKYDVGIIIGRFQVPELHEGHQELIEHVCSLHDKVVILLGLSPIKATQRNPLDYEARRQMIQEAYPQINVLYVKDMSNDEAWSKQVDERIEDVVTPHQTVVLYGGRDSFIEHYHGRYATQELEAERITSGETIRKEVSAKSVRQSPDFRAGAVWSVFNRFPTVYTCVDVAIFNEDETKILLGRKEHEKAWRLIGGFSDPTSPSFEADARREVQEEVGIAITDPQYIGSFAVDDWRYRNEVDGIRTLLFKAKKFSGAVKADDDIAEAKWFDIDTLGLNDVVKNHWPLIEAVMATHPSQR